VVFFTEVLTILINLALQKWEVELGNKKMVGEYI